METPAPFLLAQLPSLSPWRMRQGGIVVWPCVVSSSDEQGLGSGVAGEKVLPGLCLLTPSVPCQISLCKQACFGHPSQTGR